MSPLCMLLFFLPNGAIISRKAEAWEVQMLAPAPDLRDRSRTDEPVLRSDILEYHPDLIGGDLGVFGDRAHRRLGDLLLGFGRLAFDDLDIDERHLVLPGAAILGPAAACATW